MTGEMGEAVLVQFAQRRRLISGRDLVIIASAPILAWRPRDPTSRSAMLPIITLVPSCGGYRVHTLVCRGSGLPLRCFLAPATSHDAPLPGPFSPGRFASLGGSPLWAAPAQRPPGFRLVGVRLIACIHATLGAVAVVVPWDPKRQENRSCPPPTWSAVELGKRTSIEHCFGRVFGLFGLFRLQRPPLAGWSAIDYGRAASFKTQGTRVGRTSRVDDDPERSPPRTWLHEARSYTQPVNLKLAMRVDQLKLPLAGRYSLVYQKVQSSPGSTVIAL